MVETNEILAEHWKEIQDLKKRVEHLENLNRT